MGPDFERHCPRSQSKETCFSYQEMFFLSGILFHKLIPVFPSLKSIMAFSYIFTSKDCNIKLSKISSVRNVKQPRIKD